MRHCKLLFSLSMIAVLCCLAFSPLAADHKPNHAPDGGGGDVTVDFIYFYHDYALQVMAPDGSGKTRLLELVSGEPSHEPHGEGRWFLRGSAGGGLAATKDDGTTVVLLSAGDDGDWEVVGGEKRWVADGETWDGMVSWVCRRTGQTEETAIARAPVIYDSHTGDIAGLDPDSIERFNVPSLRYDWSPDGTMIAFTDEDLGMLWVYDTLPQNFQLLATDLVWEVPAWSPDGSRIAYNVQDGLTSQLKTIDVIDGTVTIVDEGRRRSILEGTIVYAGRWSPDSSQLVYRKYSSPGYDQNVDIVTRNANGKGGATVLTRELRTWTNVPIILGWRAE